MKEHLERAKIVQDDEFYTSYEDVELGTAYFLPQLKGKVVYCNCDKYSKSNFVKFFHDKFEEIGLKSLMAVNIQTNEKYVFNGAEEIITPLKDARFGTEETDEIMKECDVVITNPPFSVFREYFKNLMDSGKKFLIIAPLLSLSYSVVFDAFLHDKVRLGQHRKSHSLFARPDGVGKKIQIIWLTNLDSPYPEPTELKMSYKPDYHRTYDNFHEFINVPKTKDIPKDYGGWMGLPITFLYIYNPTQFELSEEYRINHNLYIDGKKLFLRVFAKIKK